MNNHQDKLKDSTKMDEFNKYSNLGDENDPADGYEPDLAKDRGEINSSDIPIDGMKQTTDLSNVISIPQTHNSYPEIMMLKAGSLSEIPQAVQALRENKSAILNLNSLNPELEQRALGFIAGAICAINGHIQPIGERVFLLTPQTVRVSNKSGVIHEARATSKSSKVRGDERSSWEEIFIRLA